MKVASFKYKGHYVIVYKNEDELFTVSVQNPEGTMAGEDARYETKSIAERAAVEFIDQWIIEEIYHDLI